VRVGEFFFVYDVITVPKLSFLIVRFPTERGAVSKGLSEPFQVTPNARILCQVDWDPIIGIWPQGEEIRLCGPVTDLLTFLTGLQQFLWQIELSGKCWWEQEHLFRIRKKTNPDRLNEPRNGLMATKLTTLHNALN
jgi:hypothetical protein